MRQIAQKSVELQGCMPACGSSMGYPLLLGCCAAINKAFDAWQERRGIAKFSSWKNRNPRPERQAPPVPPPRPVVERPAKVERTIKVPRTKLSDGEARERALERKRAYRLANKEKVRAINREYQKRRRAAMTPEERKAESLDVSFYRKKTSTL